MSGAGPTEAPALVRMEYTIPDAGVLSTRLWGAPLPTTEWGRHGFDGVAEARGACRGPVVLAKPCGKTQLTTLSWLSLPN